MPLFKKGNDFTSTPFGRNQYLRSAEGTKFESYTYSAAAHPTEAIDDSPNEKVLQSGEVVAKITSGPEAGKIGVFQAGATDGRADLENIVGVNDTFAPWSLLEGDIEVGVLYEGTIVQGWCFERDADGNRIPLTDATRDAMRNAVGMNITAK